MVSVGAIGGNASVHVWMVAIVTWMGRGTQLTVCVCVCVCAWRRGGRGEEMV